MRLIGIILIALGVLALIYQGFTYTQREKVMEIGSLQVTSDNEKFVWVPPVVGLAALAGGVALVAMSRRGGRLA
jgi:hypothetical protein